jgi:ubiquinone biosynthesis protein
MKIEAIARLERNAKRAGEIAAVFARYGLAEWLSAVPLSWLREKLKTEKGEDIKTLSVGERVRRAFTDLGPTFIKLGQVLSTRPDVVGAEVAAQLSQLQAGTPADPSERIREVIRAELGRPPEELFERFDDEPLASASIAQVHRARLKTGQEVVVKVQHPGAAEKAGPDLEILEGLAEFLEKHSEALRAYQPAAIARHFRRTLWRELDFTHERHNLEDFARNFADDATVRFPEVHREFCTEQVLTMDYLEGITGTNGNALKSAQVDLNQFVRRGANVFLNMIFRDGLYHADPHPGNLMLLPQGVVGVIDCGQAGRIDEQLREEVEMMLLAVGSRDVGRLTETVLRLGSAPPDCPRDRLRADLNEFVGDHVGHSLRDLDLGAALRDLIEIVRRYRIVLRPPLALLLKTLIVLEGTSRLLAPDVSLAELIEPHYLRALRRRLSPRQILVRAGRAYTDWERFLSALPRDLEDVLGRVRAGTYTVRLSHRHLDPVVNRLVLGVVTAALVIGGAQLWSSQTPPLVLGIPVLGAMAFLLAMTLGWRLYRGIKQSRGPESKE